MDVSNFFSGEEKNLKTLPMPWEICPHCNTNGGMVGQVNYNYFGFLGIPIFGINTERIIVCTKCKKLFGLLNTPKDLRERFHEQTKDVKMKNKWTYFFGLILIGVVILVLIIYKQF